MMADSGPTVSLTEFVDSWLDVLSRAQADATAKGLSEDSKLYEFKYIKDLLDSLSWQLRTYIEHPDPLHPTLRVTLSNGKLVVSDGNDMNLSGKTRRARLEILMQKIMQEKGSDGGKRYKNLEQLFKSMPFAPTKLAKDVKWKRVDTKLPSSSKAKVTQYYYDPANVDDDLATGTVWASDVNLQDIDQFRNNDGRFNKTMKARFRTPNYATINESLVDEAARQLGPYSFINTSDAKQVPPSRANIKQWTKNKNVVGALGINGLFAPTAGNQENIANNPTPITIAKNSVSATGGPVTQEQAVGAATVLQQNDLIDFSEKSSNGAVPSASTVLAVNGLTSNNKNSLRRINANPTAPTVRANTTQTQNGAPPTNKQVDNASQMLQNGRPPAGTQVVAAVQATLANGGLKANGANGLANIMASPSGPTVQANASTSNGRPPTNEQASKVAEAVNKVFEKAPTNSK
jgi:hypothetical protein